MHVFTYSTPHRCPHLLCNKLHTGQAHDDVMREKFIVTKDAGSVDCIVEPITSYFNPMAAS